MKNTAIWACRILLGLTGLLLLYSGFMWAFFPDSHLLDNGIVANSILGLNMIKSDIGAPLMAVGLLQILFIFKWKEFFIPLLIIQFSFLIVRTVSFFVDGSHPMIITGIVMELVVPLLNIALHRLRKTS